MPFNFVVSNKIQPIWLELLARLEGFSYLCILFFILFFCIAISRMYGS